MVEDAYCKIGDPDPCLSPEEFYQALKVQLTGYRGIQAAELPTPGMAQLLNTIEGVSTHPKVPDDDFLHRIVQFTEITGRSTITNGPDVLCSQRLTQHDLRWRSQHHEVEATVEPVNGE